MTAATRLDSQHRVGGRRIPGVGGRTEQQRELPTGAAAIHANAVGVDAVLARVLTDERTARRTSATIAAMGYLRLLPCLTANTVNPFSFNNGDR